MTENVARRVAQRDRKVRFRPHLLERFAVLREEILDAFVERDDVAAQHAFAGRAGERIIEVFLDALAVPERQHMHARVVIAESRDERIAAIEREREAAHQLAKESRAGLRSRALVDEPQDVQIFLFAGFHSARD